MSKRAEAAAYNYAKENGTLGYDYNQIYDAAKNGYEQAEKDLALTWEDVKKIVLIAEEVGLDNQCRNYPWRDDEAFYEEVLRRFNESKNKK